MRIKMKGSDLNTFMPPMRQAQLLVEVNSALETMVRIDQQIEHWKRMPDTNMYKIQMLDELQFLKKGRV